jgi:hypothetical protein
MGNKKINFRTSVIALVILFAAFSRLIPHPANFAPIGAMALFGAAHFSKRYLAFLVPLVSMWLSDMVLNNVVYAQHFDHFAWFYPGFYWTYAAFIVIGLAGFFLLKKTKPKNIIVASLAASILFFLISNFGVWASGTLYPKTIGGLLACYTAAIPFFRNTIMGDLVYSSVLFGAFELAQAKFPVLQRKVKLYG